MFHFLQKKKKKVKKSEKKIIDFQKNFLGREKQGFGRKKRNMEKNRNMVTRLTDELRINFKHLLACGAFFWQIDRKQCNFQKWFYNWSCTLSKVVEQFFCKFCF